MTLAKLKLVAVTAINLLILGCSSTPYPSSSLLDTYDSVHRAGARDTIKILREGLRERRVYGVTDPYIPIRSPEEIVPIWVPTQPDKKTGRLVHGHWENSVIRWSNWYTE